MKNKNDYFEDVSYDDIVANYKNISEYMNNDVVADGIKNLMNSLMEQRKTEFVCELENVVSKEEFYTYIKVKKQLDEIHQKINEKQEQMIKEFFNNGGKLWK